MIELEVCIDSVHGAKTAIDNGVRRLEVCSSLGDGGLTPSIGLVKLIDKWGERVSGIKQFIMIRPRAGDFAYSPEEVEVMKDDIRAIMALNLPTVTGFVFGVLSGSRELDVSINRELIKAAGSKQCTLHRAIDVSDDYLQSGRIASQLGFSCILSSGSQPKAIQGTNHLQQLVSQANIDVMAGSGVNASNVKEIITKTGVRKVHFSAKARVPSGYQGISMGTSDSGDGYDSVGADKVKEMLSTLSKL